MMNLKKQIDIAVICEPSCQSLLEIINDLVFNIKNINPDLNIQIHYVLNHISISHCILCKECFKTQDLGLVKEIIKPPRADLNVEKVKF